MGKTTTKKMAFIKKVEKARFRVVIMDAHTKKSKTISLIDGNSSLSDIHGFIVKSFENYKRD